MARRSRQDMKNKDDSGRIFCYAIYVRKSTEEDDSRSIHNQISVLQGAVQKIISEDCVNQYRNKGVYADEDYTGTDTERPAFQRLLRDLGKGKINMVLVTDLSRLSRNTAQCIHYVQGIFVALEIRFVSLQLPELDSFTNPDRIYSLEVPIQSMMNENHCAETSQKVRRTFHRLREEGKFIGAFAPYGWEKDPKDHHRLMKDPTACYVLDLMKDWLLAGNSVGQITKMLNDRCIPNPTAYKAAKGFKYHNSHPCPSSFWNPVTVSRMLRRPENTGCLAQGKEKVMSYKIHTRVPVPKENWIYCEGAIPAVFTEEEQDQIYQCLARDTRRSPSRESRSPYLFSGFLRCADCGKSIVRKKSKNYVYYVCNTYKSTGVGCTRHSIRHEKLESAVLTAIQMQIALGVYFQNVWKSMIETDTSGTQRQVKKEISTQKRHLQKFTNLKKTIYEDWKNGNLTKEEYCQLKSDYHRKIEECVRLLDLLEKQQKEIEKKGNQVNRDFASFVESCQITTLTRDLLTAFVDRIFIYEGGRITIQFRYGDPYQKMVTSNRSPNITAPTGPVGPVGPVAPVAPVAPAAPTGP